MFLWSDRRRQDRACEGSGTGAFDDEKNIVRLDMSEYMEKIFCIRLIGALPVMWDTRRAVS